MGVHSECLRELCDMERMINLMSGVLTRRAGVGRYMLRLCCVFAQSMGPVNDSAR